MPFTLPYRFFSDRLPRERTRKTATYASLRPFFFNVFCTILVLSYAASKTSKTVAGIIYNAPYHPVQISPNQRMTHHPLLKRRKPQSAIIKHHGVYHQTSRLFSEKFDAVPVLVDEDEHIAVPQVNGHLVVHDSGKHMEALAHVSRLREQPVPHALIQTKHGLSLHTLWPGGVPGS